MVYCCCQIFLTRIASQHSLLVVICLPPLCNSVCGNAQVLASRNRWHAHPARAAALRFTLGATVALAAAALAKPTAAATAAQLRHPGQPVALHIGLSPSALASRTGALNLQGTVPCSVPPAVAAAAAVVPGHAAR
eukprot:scaffold2810_cov39-Phaeocystis_antarctica.AAC.1